MTAKEFTKKMDSVVKNARERGFTAFKKDTNRYMLLNTSIFLNSREEVCVCGDKYTFRFKLSEVASMSRGVGSVGFFDKDDFTVATVVWL